MNTIPGFPLTQMNLSKSEKSRKTVLKICFQCEIGRRQARFELTNYIQPCNVFFFFFCSLDPVNRINHIVWKVPLLEVHSHGKFKLSPTFSIDPENISSVLDTM